ncbi:MAG: ATP synthase F1 subunit epsilon [Sandaracinaceae bacterium]|nr:ATP synthase F1 subunit epsilon [Sandaracinaceae bacterium]
MATEGLLKLEVATPTGLVLSTEASAVQAPSVEGEFGVLPGHLPLLAALKAGVLSYTENGEQKFAAVGAGFVEAGPKSVLLLTNSFVEKSKIKLEEAREEFASAEKALAEFGGPIDSHDAKELVQKLEWARARLDTALAS